MRGSGTVSLLSTFAACWRPRYLCCHHPSLTTELSVSVISTWTKRPAALQVSFRFTLTDLNYWRIQLPRPGSYWVLSFFSMQTATVGLCMVWAYLINFLLHTHTQNLETSKLWAKLNIASSYVNYLRCFLIMMCSCGTITRVPGTEWVLG